jgi:hypothetical protein
MAVRSFAFLVRITLAGDCGLSCDEPNISLVERELRLIDGAALQVPHYLQ